VEARLLLPRRLLVAWWELVWRRLPIGGGAKEARPLRGCEEARHPQVDELSPPFVAVAASTCGRLEDGLVLAAASSIDVLRGCCRLGGAHGGGGGADARVLGPEDFVAAAGEAKWHAFELVRRISEVEAETAR
jgi:hypothetical protein